MKARRCACLRDAPGLAAGAAKTGGVQACRGFAGRTCPGQDSSTSTARVLAGPAPAVSATARATRGAVAAAMRRACPDFRQALWPELLAGLRGLRASRLPGLGGLGGFGRAPGPVPDFGNGPAATAGVRGAGPAIGPHAAAQRVPRANARNRRVQAPRQRERVQNFARRQRHRSRQA